MTSTSTSATPPKPAELWSGTGRVFFDSDRPCIALDMASATKIGEQPPAGSTVLYCGKKYTVNSFGAYVVNMTSQDPYTARIEKSVPVAFCAFMSDAEVAAAELDEKRKAAEGLPSAVLLELLQAKLAQEGK